MKPLLTFALILLTSFCLKAQNATQEEFNYMSKGFARMINEGLDLKQGYDQSDNHAIHYSGQQIQIHIL